MKVFYFNKLKDNIISSFLKLAFGNSWNKFNKVIKLIQNFIKKLQDNLRNKYYLIKIKFNNIVNKVNILNFLKLKNFVKIKITNLTLLTGLYLIEKKVF